MYEVSDDHYLRMEDGSCHVIDIRFLESMGIAGFEDTAEEIRRMIAVANNHRLWLVVDSKGDEVLSYRFATIDGVDRTLNPFESIVLALETAVATNSFGDVEVLGVSMNIREVTEECKLKEAYRAFACQVNHTPEEERIDITRVLAVTNDEGLFLTTYDNGNKGFAPDVLKDKDLCERLRKWYDKHWALHLKSGKRLL